MAGPRATRSFGLLENALAARRAAVANGLIPAHLRSGRLLDIGCGPTPYFLKGTAFADKVGVDLVARGDGRAEGVKLVCADIERPPLPFPGEHFSAISMLAVIEHLRPHTVPGALAECYRLLVPQGVLILTCPAHWTGGLLRVMAGLRLVSRCQIEGHRGRYRRGHLRQVLESAGFRADDVTLGKFQFGANNWARAMKRRPGAGTA